MLNNVKKLLKKGKGWRIGWKDNPVLYQGLIGADDWAIELTQQEMQDFCRLLFQIHHTMTDMGKYLMEEESIVCEVESDLMWLGAEGYFDRYSLRIILLQGRGCEGTWTENVTQELILATQSLECF